MSRKDDLDNRSNQLNPDNDAFWDSRGWDGRPDDWEERLETGDVMPDCNDPVKTCSGVIVKWTST